MSSRANLKIRLLASIFLVGIAGTTFAGQIIVDANGTGDYTTIQEAINNANNGDIIEVQPGTYTGLGNRDVNFVGKAITVQGTDPCNPDVVAATIIDCQGSDVEPHWGFIFENAEQADSVLAGLTIKNAYTDFDGAAIYCYYSSPTITRCIITGNTASNGGGISCGPQSAPNISNCIISNNTAIILEGGGIDFFNSSGAIISNCIISNNTSFVDGAGISCCNSDPNIENCTITGNWAGNDGGGIYCYNSDPNISDPNISNCHISGNTSISAGGGIYCGYSSSPTIRNCCLTGNWGQDGGGGLYCKDSAPEIIHIINCTISDNLVSSSGGGGIYCDQSFLSITNSIVFANLANHSAQIYVNYSVLTVSYSDVQNGKPTPLPGSTINWESGNIDAEPNFIAPGYWDSNDTPGDESDDFWVEGEGHYTLGTGSACIDAANGDVASAADIMGELRYDDLSTDNTGGGEPNYVDMGAYEFQGQNPIYRFWSPVNQKHFYTIKEAEKDKLISIYSHVWHYESIAYYAFTTDCEPNLVPIYRFWSETLCSHFYTISEAERDKLINFYPHVWTHYEGIAFYAYPEGQQPADAMPVYRFWSKSLGTHFYTMSEREKNKLIDKFPDVWKYECIAWYAHQ